MELQQMTKEQLIARIEELSTSLNEGTCREEELKAKAIEHEKIIAELRDEGESLKNEVKVQKESTDMYRGWWDVESKKNNSLIEKINSIAVMTDCIANSVKK